MGIGTKAGLFLVRIYVGLTFILASIKKIWLDFDFSKFSEGFLKKPLLKGTLEGAIGAGDAERTMRSGLGFYENLIRDVFIPNASVMTYLVVFGEMLVGIALVVGFLTRIASAFGILMTVSFFLLTWQAGFLPWTMIHNWAFVTCLMCVVILLSGAGLVGGIDGKFRNRA
jgi:thiosulfate dehydrogenase [quinone] large subunit